MNRRLLSTSLQLGLVLGIGIPIAGCEPLAGPSLRLVTWNVHACRAGLDSISADLRRLDADIICLQEVASGQLDSPEANAVERLARSLGMHHVATPPPAKGTKEEQMAILARGELEDVEYLEAGTGRHYAISAELELTDDSEIRIICAHMTSNAPWIDVARFLVTGGRRLKEIEDLTRRLRQEDEDLILAGDFNSAPVMLEHAMLRSCMRWAVSLQPTFPTNSPTLQLDHVFVKGDGLRPARVSVEPTHASDHRQFVAEIRLTDRWALIGRSKAALFDDPRSDGAGESD